MDWFFIVTNSLYSSWKTQNFEYFPLVMNVILMLVVTLFLFVSITFHLISFGFRRRKKVISWSKYFQRNKNTSITIYKQLRYTDIHRPKYIFFTEKLRRFFLLSFTYILMVHFFFIFCFSSSYHNFGGGYVLTRGNQTLGWNKTFYAFTHQNDNYYFYISF